MPRRPRMYLPGMPYHIVQRGNNRQPCFIERDNYPYYLELWRKMSRRYGVCVHSYCLMNNHIHFLVTPDQETSVSNMMKVVGSCYAQYINKKYKRTGTLWEGRHRHSLVQTDKYFLTCMRYIELNPVRAGMVDQPEDYPWSSYGVNALGKNSWLTPHDVYLGLGRDTAARNHSYRELFKLTISKADMHQIRTAAFYCQPVADDQFKRSIEDQFGIKPGYLQRGRPRKDETRVVKK